MTLGVSHGQCRYLYWLLMLADLDRFAPGAYKSQCPARSSGSQNPNSALLLAAQWVEERVMELHNPDLMSLRAVHRLECCDARSEGLDGSSLLIDRRPHCVIAGHSSSG